jgi:hypothetical protein
MTAVRDALIARDVPRENIDAGVLSAERSARRWAGCRGVQQKFDQVDWAAETR